MGKEKYFCWSISSWNGGAAEDCSNSGIDATNELLTFYGKPLRVQREIHEYLCSRRGWLPSGYLEQDLPVLRKVLVTRERLRVGRSLPDSGPRTGWVSAIS